MHLDVYDSGVKPEIKHAVPLVFVHGASHGKWCWLEHFVPYFEDLGYRCVAMDLRGHGGSEGKDQINKNRIDDYVEDIQSVLGGLGGKVVLIGHSMGGAAIERYIQKHPVAVAILISPVPAHGGAAFVNRAAKRLGNRGMLKLIISKNMLSAIKNPQIAKTMFFSEEMPEEEYKKYYELLGNESYPASMEVRKAIVTGDPNPLNIPIMVIGAMHDGCFLPEEIEENAVLYGVKPVFFDGGHDVMLDRCWKDAAESIYKWLISQGI